MDTIIKELKPYMVSEYIDFFDSRAFSDGNINKGCYCVWHHLIWSSFFVTIILKDIQVVIDAFFQME